MAELDPTAQVAVGADLEAETAEFVINPRTAR
jgi:hypothetical protein